MNQLKSKIFENFNGIILINKKKGITSFKVIRELRKVFFLKKIGHAGTLDPIADGLLIVLLNKATKFSNYFLSMDKEYTAKIKLGISTDSWDSDGEIISSVDVGKIETEEILDTISHLKGDFNQTPPIFSAIKYKGKPAYYYARRNEEIKLKSKIVKIYDISLLAFYGNELILKINCSSGTYIRSIANEIGKTLGCGAVVTALRRDKIGNFYLDDSTEVELLENEGLKPGMNSQEMLNLYRFSIISLERLNII